MDELVPRVAALADIYGETASEGAESDCRSRLRSLLEKFKNTYGYSPDFVARSPGRVNVIGEHIDYSLFDVLPMAVTADCLIAVRAGASASNSPTIRIANLDSAKFPAQSFNVGPDDGLTIDATRHEWTNYFKAGFRGSLDFLRKLHGKDWLPKGMDVVVHGNVPAGGGLSSSAALVCASALATMAANDHHVSKHDLLELAVVSERAVGVFSGGMDQAASIFSKKDYLLDCAFYPSFHAEQVAVPPSDPEAIFMVAQSFVTADKHITAPRNYNLRVVECTLAAVVLAKLHGLQLQEDSSPLGSSLKNVQEQILQQTGSSRVEPQEKLLAIIRIVEDKLSNANGYTRDDIASVLGLTVDVLEKEYMSKFPVETDRFQLRNRALHVFNEAKRVLEFKAILSEARKSGRGLRIPELRRMGGLMNATQTSCAHIYDCSAPELDQICEIARKAGTHGSRLTGAGWGGCTVHLLASSQVEVVKKALKEEYYDKHFPGMTEERLEQALVISKPGSGSAILEGDVLAM